MAKDEDLKGKPTELPNVWALGSEGRNPYLHNVFILLGVDADASQKEFSRVCQRADERVAQNQADTVNGRAVLATDVARAKGLAANAVEYAAERLLAHTAHQVDVSRFDTATKAIDQMKLDKPADLMPLPVRNVAFLTRLLPSPADLVAGQAAPVSREQLDQLFRPVAADERIYDL